MKKNSLLSFIFLIFLSACIQQAEITYNDLLESNIYTGAELVKGLEDSSIKILEVEGAPVSFFVNHDAKGSFYSENDKIKYFHPGEEGYYLIVTGIKTEKGLDYIVHKRKSNR